MKKIVLISIVHFLTFLSIGQVKILPGDQSIDLSKLKSESYSMSYLVIEDGAYAEIGKYKTNVLINNQTIELNTNLSFINSNSLWKDSHVADAKTLKPISRTSESDARKLTLAYKNEIIGDLKNNKNGQKSSIKEQIKSAFFDISIYPQIIRALPLNIGYKAIIPVYDYESSSEENRFCNVIINKVKSGNYASTFTGEHDIWEVSVYEESSKHNYQYCIDQKSRKIWKITLIPPTGNAIILKNDESDFNPIKNKFDKKESLAQIKNGKSIISGEAFARDNKNGGSLQGMAVLNVNKKQFAAKGTIIVLMPYTEYIKEWLSTNESRQKKLLPQIPLPEGANECIVETKVYDENGHFEFKNLKPGDYLISTKFVYSHDATKTEVVGFTDNYINDVYQGSDVITESHNFVADARANIKKIVSIKYEGEHVEIKLKKSL